MGGDSLLTLPALLDAALPTPSRAREVESLFADGQVTINVIAEKLLEGRPATMQFLKQLGVDLRSRCRRRAAGLRILQVLAVLPRGCS